MQDDRTEDQLLKKARQGDKESLAELLIQITPDVSRYIDSMIPVYHRSVLEAEDAMQITYSDVLADISRCRAESSVSFLDYVRIVARNNLFSVIAWLQRDKRPDPRKRVTGIDQNGSLVDFLEFIIWAGTRPSQAATRKENIELMRSAIANLPENERLAIEWYDIQGLPIGEVATRLDRKPGAVHAMRVRAHHVLRKQFGATSDYLSSI